MALRRGGLVRAARPAGDQVARTRGLRHNLALHTRRDRGRNPREGALERGASPQETPPEGEPRLHGAAYGLDGLPRRDPRSPPMTAPVATPATPRRVSSLEEAKSPVAPPMYRSPRGMPSSRPPRTAPSTRYVPEPRPAFVGRLLGSDRGVWPRTSPFHKEACDASSAIDGAWATTGFAELEENSRRRASSVRQLRTVVTPEESDTVQVGLRILASVG